LAAVARAEGEPAPLYRVHATRGQWSADLLPGMQTAGYPTVDAAGAVLYLCDAQAWCEVAADSLRGWQAGPLPVTRHPYIGHAGDLPVWTVLRDRFGCVWLRNEKLAEYQCPGDPRLRQLPLTVAETASSPPHLRETADGSLIIGSQGKLAVGRPGAFRVLTVENGAPDSIDAAVAADGTFWLAGEQGLFRFMYPFRAEYWTEREGIEGPRTVLRLGNRTWLAGGKGIQLLSPDRARWTTLPSTLEMGRARDLVAGPDGTILAALVYRRVVQIDAAGAIVRGPPSRNPKAE
jgi:hypothetical protein